MNRLTILFDGRCGLCVRMAAWAARQPAYVELEWLASGSAAAHRRYPSLLGGDDPDELVAIADDGSVYRDDAAWIMVLYALRDFREWSFRLAHPDLRPFARRAVAWLGGSRRSISERLRHAPDAQLIATFSAAAAPACETPGPSPNGRPAQPATS